VLQDAFLLTIPTFIERKNMQMEEQRGADLSSMLESVIDRNGGKWLRFILGILKNEADAEDVMQEAVRRVLAHNRLLPSEEETRMYLGRAIGNAALELYNHRKRERMRHIPILESLLMPCVDSSPHKYMEERERSDRKDQMLAVLYDGLMQLSGKEREALRLTILESRGLSIRDAGASSGIPYSTLRHRSKQALRHLRRFLERSLKTKLPESKS
jgi:RNA polymerase sigma factor (sigma-70 family)